MMARNFYNFVTWSPPTPLGLLRRQWVMSHRCIRCGESAPPPSWSSRPRATPQPVDDDTP